VNALQAEEKDFKQIDLPVNMVAKGKQDRRRQANNRTKGVLRELYAPFNSRPGNWIHDENVHKSTAIQYALIHGLPGRHILCNVILNNFDRFRPTDTRFAFFTLPRPCPIQSNLPRRPRKVTRRCCL